MKGANQAFTTQKERFLQNNLVIVGGNLQSEIFGRLWLHDGIEQDDAVDDDFLKTFEFDLVKSNKLFDAYGAKTGADPEVYEVMMLERFVGPKNKSVKRKITDRTTRFESYYCPWSPGRSWTIDLPHDGAEYFFTATLNGCTVAVERKGAVTRVSHANFTDTNLQIDQAAIDADLDLKHDAARHVVKKTDYTNVTKKAAALGSGEVLDYRATVFGFLKRGQWEFYYQSYKQFLEKKKGKTLNKVILRDRAVQIV